MTAQDTSWQAMNLMRLLVKTASVLWRLCWTSMGGSEKWHDLYEKQRMKFKSFADFVKWHNTVRYHESLDTKQYLQTPEDAFWSRLPDGCKLNVFLKRMEAGL